MTNSSIRRHLVVCLSVVLLPAISLRTADAQEKQTKEKKGVVLKHEIHSLAVSPVGEIIFVDLSSPIGATLVTVGDTLRSQLSLPADRGAVVTHVREKGPADNAGLKWDDIVLTAGDKPVTKAADLDSIMKAAAGKKVKLDVIREGKRRSVEIRIDADPTFSLALQSFDSVLSGHYIGITVVPVDRTLRSHLKLAKDQGVVVTDVVKDSPAAKAGILKHDVLLSASEKPLGKLHDLHKVVTASAGKPLSIKLLRSGKPQTLNVTPEKRPAGVVRKGEVLSLHLAPYANFLETLTVRHPAVATPSRKTTLSKVGVEEKLDRMIKQIEQLQKSLEELCKILPNKPANSPSDPGQKK